MDWLANLFGYVLNWLYSFVQNYGVAIILFSLLLKLLMLPLTYKQQKSMKKSQKVQEEINNLKFKYRNDQEKLNQETMALYKREGVSPFSGCLSTILQLFIFIAVFYLVSKPLTFMKKIDKSKIEDLTNKIVNEQVIENSEDKSTEENQEAAQENKEEKKEESGNKEEKLEKATEKKEETAENVEENKVETTENKEESDNKTQRTNYQEIKIIEKFGATDEEVNINMDFLGLDLTAVPSTNWRDFKVLILPLIYLAITLINMKYTNKLQKKSSEEKKERKAADVAKRYAKYQEEIDALEDGEEKEKKIKEFEKIKKVEEETADFEDGAVGMTKGMTFMMPVMSIMISIIAPLGLSLYWATSNLLNLIERIVVNKVIEKQEEDK